MNIYTRIGECIDSTGVIDSVLAYDANEEEILIQAGFVRNGTVSINDEIVDVYKYLPKSNQHESFKMLHMSNKPYLYQWN